MIRTPSTTEPYFVLCDDYPNQPQEQAENQASFPFPSLIADLQMDIAARLDMPTKCSLSWTCWQFYGTYAVQDFDCFAFADKCAELGYRALLEYSIARGGPFGDNTSALAAANGHLSILQLKVAHILKKHFKVNVTWSSPPGWDQVAVGASLQISFSDIPDLLSRWAYSAVRNGQHHVLEWLKVDQWRHFDKLSWIARIAIENHQLRIALNTYAQAAPLVGIEKPRRTLQVELLKAACVKGDLEAVQGVLQIQTLETFPHHNFRRVLKWDEDVPASIYAWFIEACPATLTNESLLEMFHKAVLLGNVELMLLAEKNGFEITVDLFKPENLRDVYDPLYPHPRVLKFLHERFDLQTPIFTPTYAIEKFTDSVTIDDLQWLVEHGYQFEIQKLRRCLIKHDAKGINVELWRWVLQHGYTPDNREILTVARYCRTDLLEMLWSAKSDVPDPDDAEMASALIGEFLRGISVKPDRLRPVLATAHWLLEHGYTFGSVTEGFDRFLGDLVKERPRLFRDYYDEIAALKMPISKETLQLVNNFLNKKL